MTHLVRLGKCEEHHNIDIALEQGAEADGGDRARYVLKSDPRTAKRLRACDGHAPSFELRSA